MKVFLDHRETFRDRTRTLEREEALLSLVEQEAEARKRGLLRTLIGLLFTPESTLSAFPPGACFALAKAALELMDRRQEDIALLCWMPDEGKRPLLSINLADAPVVAASLQLLTRAREGKAKLLAYLPLFAQRNGEGLFGLSATGPEGAREALIVLELEGGDDCEQFVREALTAAIQVFNDEKKLKACLDSLSTVPLPKPCLELLDWLRAGAFLPYAYRRWTQSPRELKAECAEERLGIARMGDTVLGCLFGSARGETPLSPESPFVLRQTCLPCPLCRSERSIRVGCSETLPDRSVLEHEFLGLFSVRALEKPTFTVPALRNNIVHALHGLSVMPDSYDFQRAVDLFNAFPKVELFSRGRNNSI